MNIQIERHIPPRFNRPILYPILIPTWENGATYDAVSYIEAITKFEMKCEVKLTGLFRQIGIRSSVKRDRYSLPYKYEIIAELERGSNIDDVYNLNNIARVFVKDLLDKNVGKIRFYLLVDVITEDESMSKKYNGKVVYKFRYMIHH